MEYLTAHGYPEEALVFEWKIDARHMVDLAVIDPTTNRPIALFELKRRKNPQNLSMATRQLAAYKKALGDDQVPTYIVFPAEGIPPFEMYHLKKDASESNELFDTQIERVPDYSVMKNSAISKEILKTERQRRSTLDWFQVMCYLLAGAVVLLVVLDFLGIVRITPERLTLIGIIIALIIVPVASKLKILGMEFERRKKEEKPD
jgi:predicted nucleic acid-binding Zn ribbon protein